MRCSQARRLLSLSLDGELDARRQTRLRDHLGLCAECRRFGERLRACHARLQALPLPEPSSGFAARVMSAIPIVRRPGRRASWLSILRPARVAAALLAMICGAMAARSMNGTPTGQATAGGSSVEQPYARWFAALPEDSPAARYVALLGAVEE